MLKYGLCGGGLGSFIADVHIRGIEATHAATLVAGCFDLDPDINVRTAQARGLDPSRVYATATEMAKAEGARNDGIDFVVIATWNVSHYEIAKAFLNAGIHVACEKPLTTDAWQAKELQQLARDKHLLFYVNFTYAGYPILQHAREIIRRGDLGDIVMVMGEYAQDWLAGNTGIAPWRTDPASTGRMNCVADIGSHVMFSAHFLTGLEVSEVCCQLDNVGGFKTDTNASVMMKYDNGASGIYWASQVAHGNDNAIRLRIYGTKGSIEWRNEEAEVFKLTLAGNPSMTISKGRRYMLPYSSSGRLPAGHHEGLYYCFANNYGPFLAAIDGKEGGYFPTVDDGVRAMNWLEACWESNRTHAWVKPLAPDSTQEARR